jgi:gliding motility-associated-like protein
MLLSEKHATMTGRMRKNSKANQFTDNEVYVYNRWGELVFYSKGYNSDWDGIYHDSILPTGEYVYEIKNASTTFGFIYTGLLCVIY